MENDQQLQNEPDQPDHIFDESDLLQQYQYASQGQRFLNWLIDNLLMRYGLSYLTGTGVALILNLIAPDFLYNLVYNEDGRENTFGLLVAGYIIGFFNYNIYYTLCEKLFRGYTLGKLITGTRAIRQDGNELTFRNALLRSLSRMVPFEVFSGFNTLTWHDGWTGTMVIKSR